MAAMGAKPLRGIIIAALALLLGVARAQDNEQPESDPPDRAARLAYLKGDVSLQPAGEDAWAPALLNRPLTTGDKLWTEHGARVEIQVGQSAIRLDGDTGFSFLDLGDDTLQMRMTAGTMILDVRELQGREQIEIDTPNIALAILRPGSYRVEVNDAGDATTVKIGQGEAEANGPSTNTLVHSGQAVTFRGVDELVADTSTLGAADDFDQWSMERERRGARVATSRTAEYVSPDVTGYDDLDEYGSWSSEPEYGYVWTPTRVAVGWSPYRFGRWVWVSPWGWSWVDDSPWGYAPFHYGRWAQVRNRWCWVPGPRHVRAVYAPALVGWVGSRGNYVSWVPLGPRDVYRPGHRFSRHYWERVNFANARHLDRTHVREVFERRIGNENFHNRSLADGVTAVARASFAGSQRVGERRVRFNERDMAGFEGNRQSPRIAPVRDSRLGGVVRANPRIPAAIAARQVIVKREPPAASARFTRRVPDRSESWQTSPQQDRSARMPRPQPQDDRSPRGRDIHGDAQANPRVDRPHSGGDRATDRQAERQNSRDNYGQRERPIDRENRQNPEAAPPVRLSPAEQRSQPERTRDDRPDSLQRERWQQQRDESERRNREQSSENRDSQYSRYSQRPQRTQDAVREAVARQLEQRERQQAPREREVERSRPEPRAEQPRERPRMEQPRVQPREQPREQARPQPRQERSQPQSQPSRPERQSSPERAQRQGDGNRPNKR